MSKLRRHAKRIILHVILLALGALLIYPILFAIMSSFKEPGYGLSTALIPDEFYLGNYARLLGSARFPRSVLNSAINSLGGGILGTAAAATAAYAFARLRFKGSNLLMGYLLVMLMLPGLTNLIPLYRMASDFHLLNTYTLMILIFGGYGVPLGVWIMRGFFESIPVELEEASLIDGASRFQAFWRVVLPICIPGLVATFLINFLFNWNNFFLPLVMTSETDMKLATVALYDFQHQMEGTQNELVAAACVIIMVPAIALFISSRKYFMRGMIEGALKG